MPAAAGGQPSLAVRVPAAPELRDLLRELGPLTATSANPSGGVPILDPDEVMELVEGFDAAVIDGGRLAGGPPSTIVRWGAAGWEVLRPGRATGPVLEELESTGPISS